MILRLGGCILLIVGGSGYGYCYGVRLQKSYERLGQLRQIMQALSGEIRFMKSILEDAFYHIGMRNDSPFSDFFMELYEELKKENGDVFSEIWTKTIDRYEGKLLMRKKDYKKLREFGQNMGFLDEATQLGVIELYMEELQMDQRDMSRELENKKKLYRCMGLLGGVFASVLLI